MIDLQDKNICPTMEELGEYVRNPLFTQFCSEIKSAYKCGEKWSTAPAAGRRDGT